jgi:hypothetical protein
MPRTTAGRDEGTASGPEQWPPVTVKFPLPPLIAPAELVPSPQLIVAVKPEAVSAILLSVKLAIVVLDPSATPSVALVSCTVAARLPAPLPKTLIGAAVAALFGPVSP